MSATFPRRMILAAGAAALPLLRSRGARAAPREIRFWHAMSGVNGERLEEMTRQFNASQPDFAVTPVFKGSYDDLINATVAAYRTRTQPQLVQIYERGFMTMLLSGAVVPVQELMAAQKYEIDWGDFIKPIAGYYTHKGGLAAMPFNSSTPILFFNKAHFAKAGLEKPAETWQALEAQLRQMKASGGPGSIMADDYHWSWFENYSAINDYQYATRNNGFGGLDTEFTYNRTPVVQQVGRIKRWLDDGLLQVAGQGVAASAVFTAGRSATFIASTAAHSAMVAANGLEWDAVPLPYEEGRAARNSVIGGAVLWALRGHPEPDNAGTAAFLAFVAKPETQVWWHKATGYVPATNAAYALAKSQGWYKERPTQEIAVQQLSRGEPTANSLGYRFGNFTQTMLAQREEAERAFAGQKSPQQAMDDAVARGNEILRRFERLNAGRY
ncbi:extracellular solute-binding protein [Pararoseomonas indoligenes]|uniref:sn-glycerol-3-phosphate-binding periplasmic protein UgpB n=1 Tax=Roseomonas indoligenes TaxID=2820811 RepID=A0A940S875_9PROT|nr:extracellular solute-binding protein [Pararoseomonas indoligenes]MBP0493888.1 extracellular solute-binding protein [Pararoseomonas indoligenes]